MASFFEKLKRGMAIETVSDTEELIEEADKEQNNNKDIKEEIEAPIEENKPEEIPQVPLGPKELKPEELEEKLKEGENEQRIENTSLKDFLLKNIVKEEEEKLPKKGKSRKKEVKKNIKLKEIVNNDSVSAKATADKAKKWFETEGQLVVDVYETDGELVIQSAIAGTNPDDLDISIENDVVIIKGKEKKLLKNHPGIIFSKNATGGIFQEK